MPFNFLVPTCTCSKQTFRYKAKTPKSIELVVKSDEDEKVVFFEIDNQSNKISLFREHCEMTGDNQPICDLLIYYFSESDKRKVKKKEKILCLVELKGLEIDHAIKQIENTLSKVQCKFHDKTSDYWPVKWCAYILTNRLGSMPSEKRKEYLKKLNDVLHSHNGKITDEGDIGRFLRTV